MAATKSDTDADLASTLTSVLTALVPPPPPPRRAYAVVTAELAAARKHFREMEPRVRDDRQRVENTIRAKDCFLIARTNAIKNGTFIQQDEWGPYSNRNMPQIATPDLVLTEEFHHLHYSISALEAEMVQFTALEKISA
jgi:hypothetical protein